METKLVPADHIVDYKMHQLVEQLQQRVVVVSTVIAFVAGFVMQDVAVTFWLFVAGVGLAAAVTVPPWPFLSSTPIDWREPRPEVGKKADEASSLGDSLKYAGIVVVAIVLAYVFPERANTILLNVQTLCARLLQAARS